MSDSQEEARKHFKLSPSTRKPWTYETRYFIFSVHLADDYWAYLDKSNNLAREYFAISKVTNRDGVSFYKFCLFKLSVSFYF